MTADAAQGQSSLITTKTIIDDLNMKVDFLEKHVLYKIKDTILSQDRDLKKTIDFINKSFQI